MTLQYAGIQVEHREIELRNKPQSMLMASPKGTVPVLIVGDLVLDQSVEIMRWALQQSDPDNWGGVDDVAAQVWIERNDGPFKVLLDQYKYPNRHPNLNQVDVFNAAIALMLKPLDEALDTNHYILGNKQHWVDVAIFPFIRQFSMVHPQQFEQVQLPALKNWLTKHLRSELFHSVMHKHDAWVD